MFKLLIRLLIIFSVCSTLYSNEISSAVKYIEQPFDVLNYDANINFTNIANKQIQANCTIELLWKDKSQDNRFFFNLKNLLVDSCFYNGKRIIPQLSQEKVDDDNYYIINPEGDYKDTSNVLVFYSGTMENEGGDMAWGGVTYQEDILFSMGVGFNNPYVSSTRFWLPCYDHPSDKALYKLRITVNDDLVVASNGNLLIEEPAGDGKITYRWTGSQPAATYMLTFAVGKFRRLEFGNENLSMPVFTLEKDINNCNTGFKLLQKMVSTYEKYFGQYPFEKVGYVVTPIGSMEHQTMISLAAGAISTSDTVSLTVAHELAHQWFGGLVTPTDFRDAWLNESFASFCEALYTEELLGKAAYLAKLSKDISTYFSSAASEGIFPLWDFKRTNPSSNYPVTIYYKGSVVLAMLRNEIGDEAFFSAIKNYIEKHRNSNVTTTDFISEVNSASGKDMQWFFDQWVYGKGYPKLNISTFYHPYEDNPNIGRVEINVVQTQDASWGIYKNLPIEMVMYNGQNYTLKDIFVNQKEEHIVLDSIPKFTSTAFNMGYTYKVLAKIINQGLDVADNQESDRLQISPNPASDYILINGNTNELLTVKIFDLEGKIIFSKDNYKLNTKIEIAKLPVGVYTIVIGYNNRKEVIKFCKE